MASVNKASSPSGPYERTADPTPRIVNMTVTSDSVSATCRLALEPGTRKVVIFWGDGTQSLHDIKPWLGAQAGVFEFIHVYNPDANDPDFYTPGFIMYDITVLTVDAVGDVDVRPVDHQIVPRYRIDIFPLSMRQLSPCDTVGNENKFRIVLIRNKQKVAEEEKITNQSFYPTAWLPIEGSAFTAEVTPRDGIEYRGAYQQIMITQVDPLLDEVGQMVIGHRFNEQDKEYSRIMKLEQQHFGVGSCEIGIRYFARSRPIIPYSETPPVLSRD